RAYEVGAACSRAVAAARRREAAGRHRIGPDVVAILVREELLRRCIAARLVEGQEAAGLQTLLAGDLVLTGSPVVIVTGAHRGLVRSSLVLTVEPALVRTRRSVGIAQVRRAGRRVDG